MGGIWVIRCAMTLAANVFKCDRFDVVKWDGMKGTPSEKCDSLPGYRIPPAFINSSRLPVESQLFADLERAIRTGL